MNFYQIQFANGKSFELKAYDDNQGDLRGKALILRWNQPSAEVFRTNPYDANFRKPVSSLVNESYDPTKPTLDRDPAYLHEPMKKKKSTKVRKERIKKEKSDNPNAGPRSTHLVPLKELADKLGIEPGSIRRKLRSANTEKPEGGWGWTSWEDPTVIQIQEWFTN